MGNASKGFMNDNRGWVRRQVADRRTVGAVQVGAPGFAPAMAASMDARRLVEELQIHQLELEMQNDELCRAQLDLQASRESYFELYDQAPVGYLTLSERSLIQELNQKAIELVGLSRSQMLNQPFTRLVHAEDQSLFYRKRNQLFVHDEPQTFELRLLHQDGSTVWVSVQAVPAHDASGNPLWRMTLSDLTEYKRTEAALFEAQKLESLGVLAGGMAHDFNNLLTSILGNIELASFDESEEGLARHHDGARESVHRAAALCQQMLAYAGKGPFIQEPVLLDALVEAQLGQLRLAVPKEVELVFECGATLQEIQADAALVEKVILSLVMNAAEAYGGGGGTVWLRTRVQTLLEDHTPSLAPGSMIKAGPCLVLEVEDAGVGMDTETLHKVFDPFFSTKFFGRGLGLASALGIMRMCWGAVEVRSSPGEGTIFVLWFPLADESFLEAAPAVETRPAPVIAARPVPAPRESPALVRNPEKDGGTILVVDDEEPVREVLGQYLRQMGHEVVEAATGEDAIRVYRQSPGRIQMVLMDMAMPRMGGIEATQRIQEEFQDARIVLMSRYEKDANRRLPESAKVVGFLRKPFHRDDLARLVTRVLEPSPEVRESRVTG